MGVEGCDGLDVLLALSPSIRTSRAIVCCPTSLPRLIRLPRMQAVFVFWVTNNLFTLSWATFARTAPESVRRTLGMPTRADFAAAQKAASAASGAAPGGPKIGFMESVRAMQEQAYKEQQQAQRNRIPIIEAKPKRPTPTPSDSPADLYEAPSTDITAHGAYNVESPRGDAEGAEVGSGVQVGEVPPSSPPPKRKFAKGLKEAEPVSRPRM